MVQSHKYWPLERPDRDFAYCTTLGHYPPPCGYEHSVEKYKTNWGGQPFSKPETPRFPIVRPSYFK